MSGLTIKQKLFIDAYLECFNATRAAERAGYNGNDNVLAAIGSQNLRKIKIAQKIQERLSESAMSTDEALGRLAEMARVDIGSFLKVDQDGDFKIDWSAAKGKTHLIKSVKHTTHGVSVELHDPQAAIDKILKAGGQYVQRHKHEVTGDIQHTNTIIVREYLSDDEETGD